MRASSKRPRVETSGVAPPPPSSIGDTMAAKSIDPAATVVPPPSTSDDSNIRRMLEKHSTPINQVAGVSHILGFMQRS